MQIGAIGASTFTPYIYNTNMVTRASMNKIQGIGDDLLEKKTDFSNLSSVGETTNPLKRGETLDFAGVLSMQMQMGRMNAARFITEPSEDKADITQAVGVNANDSVQAMANAITPVDSASQSEQTASAFDYAKAMVAYQPIDLLV